MYLIVVSYQKEIDGVIKIYDEDYWKKGLVPPEKRADEMLKKAVRNQYPLQDWIHCKHTGRPIRRSAGKFEVSIQDIKPDPPEPVQLSLFTE